MSAQLLPKVARSVKTRLGKSATTDYRNEVIRGLIFDLDGTLVDSLPGIATALNHALDELALPNHPPEVVETFIGDGILNLVIRALGPDLENQQSALLTAFQKHYSKDWKTGTHLYPGMRKLLHEFRERKIPMAVLSNKPHLYTVEIVKTLFPAGIFDPVRGHQDKFPKKPDPTTAHQIISAWNLEPGEVAYVGDSTVDLATARNGAMIPLILSWGYGTPGDFSLLDSADDLRAAIFQKR